MPISDHSLKIRELNERSSQLSSALRAVHQELNSYALIHLMLPVEILAKIFILVRDSLAVRGPSGKHWTHWVVCSYVCARWRTIALNTPELWSHVFLHLNGADVMMDRAQLYPLRLLFDSFQPTSSISTPKKIYFPKVTSLAYIDHDGANMWLDLTGTLFEPGCLPNLRTLELIDERSRGEVTALRQDFFAAFPHLQEVTLTSVWPANAECFPSNLTVLSINGAANPWRTTGLSTEGILAALARMPTLKVLELTQPHFVQDDDALSGNTFTPLPHLAYFALTGTAFACANMLNSITPDPAKTGIRLVSRNEPDRKGDDAFAPIVHALLRMLNTSTSYKPRSVDIRSKHYYNSLQIVAKDTPLSCRSAIRVQPGFEDCTTALLPGEISLSIAAEYDTVQVNPASISGVFAKDTVDFLALYHDTGHIKTWGPTLRQYAHIEDLVLDTSGIDTGGTYHGVLARSLRRVRLLGGYSVRLQPSIVERLSRKRAARRGDPLDVLFLDADAAKDARRVVLAGLRASMLAKEVCMINGQDVASVA